MIDKNNILDLVNKSKNMRKHIINMTYHAGGYGAHIGGALSLVEILSVLFGKVLNYNKNNLAEENRDRFILSKGHGALAIYAAFREYNLISQETMETFRKSGSWLTAHPTIDVSKGIEFSSGSLGQGLGQGIGTSIALRLKNNNKSKVYVILGDGECDEGSIWEGAMLAPQLKLDNLIVIIDKNGLQCDDKTSNIIDLSNIENVWKNFGWDAVTVDGHNEEMIYNALIQQSNKPRVIIANTIKGKGVSFIENEPKWHMGRLTKQQYIQAMEEQGERVEL